MATPSRAPHPPISGRFDGAAVRPGVPGGVLSRGDVANRRGFDAVLGNPPWDRMLHRDKEFFASYDFEILNTPT